MRAAAFELVDLRAIRDALLDPALVQWEGMTIAAEVIPADPYVGGDSFFVDDGATETTVMADGDVIGQGLSAVRPSACTRTALALVAPFSDDPGRLCGVNVAPDKRVGESAEFVTAACMTYEPPIEASALRRGRPSSRSAPRLRCRTDSRTHRSKAWRLPAGCDQTPCCLTFTFVMVMGSLSPSAFRRGWVPRRPDLERSRRGV